jgi:hypothetical protein
LLKEQGFQGMDASLKESLFEYGLAWRELPDGEFLFVHRHTSMPKRFDRTTLNVKNDLKKEFDWINWADVASFTGTPFENWLDLSFPHKISDLINYYGVENVFGTTYWEGFKIKED